MRLVWKLCLAISLAVCTVLGVAVWLRISEESEAERHEEQRDQVLVGSSVASVLRAAWASKDGQRARELASALNAQNLPHVSVRWIAPEQIQQAVMGPVGARLFKEMAGAKTFIAESSPEPVMSTYVFVELPGSQRGAVEVIESLHAMRQGRDRILRRWGAIGAIIVVLCTLLVFGFGVRIVARPLRAAVDHAKRIGAGDLTSNLAVSPRDEIQDVASALNKMCERLREARDNSERETAKRMKTLQQLRHAERLSTVGALASGIAHQLGTPLNVIRVRGSMIASGEVSAPRMRELGAIIVEHVDRVSDSIQQLLGYARRAKPTLASGDVVLVVQQSVRLVEPLAHERNISLDIESTDKEIAMQLDADQIHHAVTNLVVNAVQASPNGSRVQVQVSRVGRRVHIEVSDEGEGIAPEHLQHIFEPFYTTKAASEGTGLGLSVANEIVIEHRGMISVHSELGKGTTFRIVLPTVRETSSIRVQVPS